MMNKRALLWGGMVFAVVTAASCYLYGVVKTPRELAQQRINAIIRNTGAAGNHDQAVHALPNSAEFDDLTGRAPGFTPKLVNAITKVFGRTGFAYAGLTAQNQAKVNDLAGSTNATVSGAAAAARTGGGGGKTDAQKVKNYITKNKVALTGYNNTITNRLAAMNNALADIDTTLAGKDLTKKAVTDFTDTQRKKLNKDIKTNENLYKNLHDAYDKLPGAGYQLEAAGSTYAKEIKTKLQAEAFIKEVQDLATNLGTNFDDAMLTALKDDATALPVPAVPPHVPAYLGDEADMATSTGGDNTIWGQYNRAVAEKTKLDALIATIEADATKAVHASIATPLNDAKNNIDGLKKFDTDFKTKVALTTKIAAIVTAKGDGAALRATLKSIADNLETDYENLDDASSKYVASGGGGGAGGKVKLNQALNDAGLVTALKGLATPKGAIIFDDTKINNTTAFDTSMSIINMMKTDLLNNINKLTKAQAVTARQKVVDELNKIFDALPADFTTIFATKAGGK